MDWACTLKPYNVASSENGLLGLDPRTLEVLSRRANGELSLFYAWIVPAYSFIESFSFFFRIPPLPDSLISSFILACVRCPSSTCRVSLYKTDICPISPIPELLEMADKAEEYGSIRGRALNGNRSSFFRIFLDSLLSLTLLLLLPLFFGGISDLPRTGLSSAGSQDYLVLCHRAWAMILLGSDLLTPYGQMGFGP